MVEEIVKASTASGQPPTLRILKVPEFVANSWLSVPNGTEIGVVTGMSDSPVSHTGVHKQLVKSAKKLKSEVPDTVPGPPTIRITVPCPVSKLISAVDNSPQKEFREVILSVNVSASGPQRPCLDGHVSGCQSFLPESSDPVFLNYLAERATRELEGEEGGESLASNPVVLSTAENNAMQKKFFSSEDNPMDEGSNAQTTGGGSRLFKYFKWDEDNSAIFDKDEGDAGFISRDTLNMQGQGGRSAQSSSMTLTMSLEEGQERLFRLFERRGTEGVSLKDIQQNVKLPPPVLKRLLDQIAEPQRERLGKRTVFELKPQFKYATQ